MKLRSNVWLVVVSLALFRNASGQSFVNLNFEDATIVPDLSSPYYPYAVYASQAIPGWTTVGFLGPNDILYNDLTLGTPNVSLLGLNDQYGPAPLDGAFSIILQAYAYGESPSISQTSLVPATAESLFLRHKPALVLQHQFSKFPWAVRTYLFLPYPRGQITRCMVVIFHQLWKVRLRT